MPTSNAPSPAGEEIPQGTRGPDDDFYCHKYQVWYRVRDCVYRGRNKTFTGCENCFQGFLNIRSLQNGVKPPVFLGLHAPEPSADCGALLPFTPPRNR